METSMIYNLILFSAGFKVLDLMIVDCKIAAISSISHISVHKRVLSVRWTNGFCMQVALM